MKTKQYLFLLFFIISTSCFAQIKDSAKREIKLQGAFNFRDLGGYKTKDGRQIKWGKIYRSAEISKLTTEDLKIITALSINRDFDFRGTLEVEKAPDKMPTHVLRISLPAGSEEVGKNDAAMMARMVNTNDGDSIMLPFYNNINSFKEKYKPIFDQLLVQQKDSAILFHCSAGKDRTGIFAALLLSSLGVDSATIFEDYLASNFYSQNKNSSVRKMLVQNFKIKENVVNDLLGVKAIYLQATFAAINKQYGSLDNYLHNVMELDNQKLEKLKLIYLK